MNVINNYKKPESQSYSTDMIRKFKYDWNKLMYNLEIHNNQYETYELKRVIITEKIITCELIIPYGLTLEMLIGKKNIIEEKLQCTFEYNYIDKNNYVDFRFYFK